MRRGRRGFFCNFELRSLHLVKLNGKIRSLTSKCNQFKMARTQDIPPEPVSNSPKFAGDGVIVVSVKFAVVNFPRVPPLGVLGADVDEEVVVLELFAGLVVEDSVEVDVVVALLLDEVLRLGGAPDEVLNAVIVSKETVGFFILPSFTCKRYVIIVHELQVFSPIKCPGDKRHHWIRCTFQGHKAYTAQQF